MKKVTLLCGLLLAISATVASAAPGVNLRWQACWGDGGLPNRNSLCNSNLGNAGQLVGSFELGAAGHPNTSGVEIVMDVASAGAVLPAWWQQNGLGQCRSVSMTMNGTISALAVACFDWASGAAAGGLAAYNIGTNGPNTARAIGGFAVPAVSIANLPGGLELFAFNAVITLIRTTGAGSCAGCLTPACIVLNSLKVASPPVAGQPSTDVVLTGPTNGTDSNYATWQGGGGIVVGTRQGCPAAVPTHNTTWSSVKTLYR